MKKIVLLVICAASASMVSSCTKVNVENISVIMPSGAPTLAMHSIINDKNFDVDIRSDATSIPAEFNLGNANFLVFDSINGTNILNKQGENAKYEYVKMLTGGNFHLLAFNKTTIEPKEDDVIYGFMGNSTPGKLFRSIYGDVNFDQNFDGIAGLRDNLLLMDENYSINGLKIDYAVVAEPACSAIINKLGAKKLNIVDINLQKEFNEKKSEWSLDYICQAGLFVNREFKNNNKDKFASLISSLNTGIDKLFFSLDDVLSNFNEIYEDDTVFISKYGFSKNVIKGVQGDNSSKNGFGIVPNNVNITVSDINNFSSLL